MNENFLEVTHDKFTFRVMKDYWYHPEECWAKEQDGIVIVGVTDFLQKTVGDVAFLELPQAGTELSRGDEAGSIETIKATVALISPVSGKIQEVNPLLDENPQFINADPYGEGWMFKMIPSDWGADRQVLWDAQAYFPRMEAKIKAEMAKKG